MIKSAHVVSHSNGVSVRSAIIIILSEFSCFVCRDDDGRRRGIVRDDGIVKYK